MCCKFKRTVNNVVTGALTITGGFFAAAAIVISLVICGISAAEQDLKVIASYTVVVFFAIGMILLIMAAIAEKVIPPDFKYTIRTARPEDGEFIVFEFEDEDHRKLNTRFETTSKNRKYMTLEDGYARIQIAYDRNVEEFLKKIKK